MTLADFVLVEFARAWQEEQGAARVDPQVVVRTRASPSFDPAAADDDHLLLYAKTLVELRLDSGEGQSAASGIRGALSAVAVIVPLLGLLAGSAMLGAALPAPDVRPVSVFQFLAEGVLLPGVFLVWTLLITGLLAGSVGRLHWVAWLLGLVRGRALRTQAGALAGRVLQRSGVTGPLFARYSHIFWLASLLAFVVLGAWRFAFVDYLFSWSSTLSFTGEQVHRLFGWLAAPVSWLPGVEAPSPAQVALSEFGSLGLAGETGGAYVHSSADVIADQALRKGWFSVLLAIVLFWGFVPRVIGLAVAHVGIARGIRRCLADPTSRTILAALQPAAPARGSEPTRDEPTPHAVSVAPASVAARAGRGLDLVAFACAPPATGVLDRLRLNRLGLSGTAHTVEADDDDDAMDAIVAHLGSDSGPEGAVVCFGVESIPDGLKEEFLTRVVGALNGGSLHVLLTEVARFQRSPRGDRLDARIGAWRAVAERAGIPGDRVHSDQEAP